MLLTPAGGVASVSTLLEVARRQEVGVWAKVKCVARVEIQAQTPDGSFRDLLKNASDLLDRCGVKHPAPEGAPWSSTSPRVPGSSSAPTAARGPLWDVTEQKIRRGALASGDDQVAWRWRRCRRRASVSGSLLVETKARPGCRRGPGVEV